MKKFWQKIKPWATNKYVITIFAFLVYIIFVDENSLIERYKAKLEIDNLRKEIKFYQQNLEADKAKIDMLNSSLENLETFAREEYLMKKKNEEIFIINE